MQIRVPVRIWPIGSNPGHPASCRADIIFAQPVAAPGVAQVFGDLPNEFREDKHSQRQVRRGMDQHQCRQRVDPDHPRLLKKVTETI